MALTGEVIRRALKNIDDRKDFADELAKAIVDNLEIKIPAGQVLIGAQAGVKNPSPINCEVR